MATTPLRTPSASIRNGRQKIRIEADGKIVRTTVILPESLDKNIEVYCVKERVSKNTAFLELLARGLTVQGYQPNRTPKLTVTY